MFSEWSLMVEPSNDNGKRRDIDIAVLYSPNRRSIYDILQQMLHKRETMIAPHTSTL